MKIKNQGKFNKGFTIIEALTVLFVFAVITMTFYSVFTLGINYIFESKNRLAAVSLANERMEIMRNLKYEDVGTMNGVPGGLIPSEENIHSGGKTYNVKTFIQYMDDPFDGISPSDLDYKRAKVTISWIGPKGKKSSVSLVSRFVPPGVEQNVAGGGVLSINVINSQGIGIPQTSVHVVNNSISPNVDVTAMTDDTGNLILPGARQSIQGYYIAVSKDDYETVNTIDPLSVAYAVTDTPASVVGGMLNVKSMIQDKLAGLKIVCEDSLGGVLPGVGFHVEGGRILGFDLLQSPVAPEYNLKSDVTTDAQGEKEFNEISPGQIFITPTGAPIGYILVSNSHFTQYDSQKNMYSFILSPGDTTREVKIKYAKEDMISLLAAIKNSLDDALVSNARVVLSNADGYSEEIETKADGSAFFPQANSPLVLGTYSLKVTAPGYNDFTEENITIDKLILKEIKLTAL
ncbi:MAG: hypothetical protein ACD_15C00125G0006 [uncultured bacterium]|nr:MAG: hypothetical protein ACD_15C00125G0006 [uncultured bacterium]HCU70626.1 hypothetical protein [Candidatus Moranbacteria bacterium]